MKLISAGFACILAAILPSSGWSIAFNDGKTPAKCDRVLFGPDSLQGLIADAPMYKSYANRLSVFTHWTRDAQAVNKNHRAYVEAPGFRLDASLPWSPASRYMLLSLEVPVITLSDPLHDANYIKFRALFVEAIQEANVFARENHYEEIALLDDEPSTVTIIDRTLPVSEREQQRWTWTAHAAKLGKDGHERLLPTQMVFLKILSDKLGIL